MYNTHTATNRIGRQDCHEFNVEYSKVMRFQQFQSTWNKKLPNLISQDQTVAHIKADITLTEATEINSLVSGGC